jgi:hypothetical protein
MGIPIHKSEPLKTLIEYMASTMNFLSYAQEFYTPLHPRGLTFVHQSL